MVELRGKKWNKRELELAGHILKPKFRHFDGGLE